MTAGYGDAGAPASRRILSAARALVARGGAAEISMGDVAAAAGVSKALIHYHFRDKDSLLTALVDDVGASVLQRGRDAQTAAADASSHALDAYWDWLAAELRAGDLSILLALSQCGSARVRAASRRVAEERREQTTARTADLFARLDLNPRVPPGLMADTIMAFTDGLAASHALTPERDPRAAFDVLWLALLTLAE